MLIRVDPRSATPIYAQVAAQVRGAISRGEIARGERLPAARDLGESLDVNMHTVLRAYAQLRDEGLLEMRRGRGVTVVGVREDARLGALAAELVAEARRYGLTGREVHALLKEHL